MSLAEDLAAAAAGLDRTAFEGLALCDPCLGRLFGKVGRGTNAERGRIVREILPVAGPPCALCAGLLGEVEKFARLAVDAFAPWAYETFAIGTRVDPAILAAEEALWQRTGSAVAEPMKSELNRVIGKRVEAGSGKVADLRRPHLTAIVDTQFDTVDVTVAPVFFYARYRKLVRGIPQTRWPCRVCRGRGCPRCGGTGKMYSTSVEEIVAAPLVEALGAEAHALHGMGREDVDARMLGRGRPFVLELKAPRRRHADLQAAAAAVNASGSVEVLGLREAAPEEIVRLKEDRAAKSYWVSVKSPPLEEGKLKEALSVLAGAHIEQRTPARVSHRRADAVRRRRIHRTTLTAFGEAGFELEVTAEAGTYVKELVHGDGGRTQPSLAGLLGLPLEVLALDVLDVHDEEGPW